MNLFKKALVGFMRLWVAGAAYIGWYGPTSGTKSSSPAAKSARLDVKTSAQLSAESSLPAKSVSARLEPESSTSDAKSARSPTTVGSAQAMDSLDRMELAFIGDYQRKEIKVSMDRVMKLLSVQINDENYSRAGSVLIVLRKSHGVSEMEVLTCMRQSFKHAGNILHGGNTRFPDLAALCAVTVSLL